MKYYFKTELKRAILEKTFIISFFIALLVMFISFLNYINFPNWSFSTVKNSYDAVDIFVRSMTSSGIIVIILPLLATIIFSDSYLLEKQTGFTKFIYSRLSIKQYVLTKVLVNSISSAIAAILSSSIFLIFLVSTFGIKFFPSNIRGPFCSLLVTNRLLYALILILMFGVSYVVMANLALGLSAFINNRYIIIIIPFFYYILCGSLIEMLGINKIFNLNLAHVYSLNHTVHTTHLAIYPILLFIIGFALFYGGVVLKNEKDL